jgi:hypothetical protein
MYQDYSGIVSFYRGCRHVLSLLPTHIQNSPCAINSAQRTESPMICVKRGVSAGQSRGCVAMFGIVAVRHSTKAIITFVTLQANTH